ncbi:hypothetical protein KY319_00090 [Candidatus Woesearchaeota archaeon]|nr:hypothetical protein [Candidatus Woesearchaeota archaeon]
MLVYNCRISVKCLYFPSVKRCSLRPESEVLDSVLVRDPFLTVFSTKDGVDLLTLLSEAEMNKVLRKFFGPSMKDLPDDKYWKAEHDERMLYAHSENTWRDKKGRVVFSNQSLKDFYHLDDPLLAKKVNGLVYVIDKEDRLIVVKREDMDKYRALLAQSTVNNSESCSTSNMPNRAPASNQP